MRLPLLFSLLLVAIASAESISLKNGNLEVRVDPATLKVESSLPMSESGDSIEPRGLAVTRATATWHRGDVHIFMELKDAALSFRCVSNSPGNFTWPIVSAAAAK